MTDIATITPSPAVDLSTMVDKIVPVAKLRGQSQRRDPGGGGINVARVIRRLGGDARAIYPVGGAIGKLLRQLLDSEGVTSHTWTIAGETRENFFVDETGAGKLITMLQFGTMSDELTRRNMEMFAAEVMPALQS